MYMFRYCVTSNIAPDLLQFGQSILHSEGLHMMDQEGHKIQ